MFSLPAVKSEQIRIPMSTPSSPMLPESSLQTDCTETGGDPNVMFIKPKMVSKGMYRQSKEGFVVDQLISYSVMFRLCQHLRSSFIS